MTADNLSSVSEYRIQARRLLKHLRCDSTDDARAAAERFRRIRSFAGETAEQILARRDRVRLKHALVVIALENGHDSWLALKESAEAAPFSPDSMRSPGREMYEVGLDVLLNRWFARYDDARASLEQSGGFLLPFDRQFFVCEPEGIRILGLEPDDPDWRRIGWDWVKPHDPEAWQRLRAQRERVLRQGA